ncbi:Similar to DNA replication complex GINS protein psf3; acc. no. Q4WQ54 [Pyronema omphalodes CBS 100304]|uniref:DNA replication complex GINS protein PSF3 n=1 Tax=Pyronema omphalodes (strain CBS 100304) TaxID=1076935 RepID=U4LTQ7_PYROM|nr:Similar to DNA replication complex GINS protein psf3; acc. no. Q4WQ54 [Pyronema omphalodes CBS 100304]
MSYYDIDAILTDSQKVPCTFEVDVPGLGYLESSSASPDIKAGTRIQLPLWLAEMLAVSQRLGTLENVISLDIPEALAPRVQNALKADPKTVELRSLATHFYGLGERVLGLFEEEELCDVLINTYKQRTAEISDLAHNPQGALGGDAGAFLRGLDEEERQLFRVAHDSYKDMKAFMGEKTRK